MAVESIPKKNEARTVIADLSAMPIWIGFLVLFVPTVYELFTTLWTSEDQAHGPMILALSLWLLVSGWPNMLKQTSDKVVGRFAALSGWFVFIIGLLFYIVGRAININPLEMGSFILLIMAVLLIRHGAAGLKVLWFPLFFMLFMIPLPGPLVSMLTLPMKLAVSFVTENILYNLNYPISRSGVIINIGQFQLLVADACAGLQTLLTLEALGMFYMNLMRHSSAFRNITLALLIIPISFTANVIRVIALTLITYYFGDEVGQGFLHGFAGMVLFISALVLILSVDNLLQWIIKVGQSKKKKAGV